MTLIEAISKATNDQTLVNEADRRSNDKIQIKIQRKIFKDFGYFYERKKGEFAEGIRYRYIDKSKIIDREVFLKICVSIVGNPSQARRASAKQLFTKEVFSQTISDLTATNKFFFGYLIYEYLDVVQKRFEKDINNRFGQAQYGNALRYGKFAMIYVISKRYSQATYTKENLNENVKPDTDSVLKKWTGFEEYVTNQPHNKTYFRKYRDAETGEQILEVNFVNYYKGTTVLKDLNKYFK